MVTGIITFFIFIILLSVLVIIHEWGHMFVAKKRGVVVKTFAVGFGKKIYSRKKNGIEYKINLLPFGGYVSLLGDDDFNSTEEGSLPQATALSKFLITVAGAFMNFLLALVFLFIFLIVVNFKFYYSNIIPNFNFAYGTNVNNVIFSAVPKDTTSSALKDKLTNNYILLSIDGKKINNAIQVEKIVDHNRGKTLTFKYQVVKSLNLFGVTLGKVQEKTLIDRKTYPKFSGPVGISLLQISHIEFPTIVSKISAIVTFPYDLMQLTFTGLGYLIHQAVIHNNSSIITTQVAGPVGIYMYTNILFQSDGVAGLLFIFGIISLSLSIMNLLPIPPLDGFYVLLAILEGIFKFKPNAKFLYYVSIIGITFFIILMVLVTLNDLVNFKII
ncbi:MAG: M50 family metallopeptidase [Patescibacteria group bacterium]